MTKSLTIIISLVLLVSLGVFSAIQVKKLNKTKTHLSEQLKSIDNLEGAIESEKEDKFLLTQLNTDLQDENQILRDSIIRLNEIIAGLRRKVQRQDNLIAELQSKVNYLQSQYDGKKKDIAVLSRKENVDQQAIAEIEAEKAMIKEQIDNFQSEQNSVITVKSEAESIIQDKMESEDRFRKIVDVVNNTRINFQDIQIKMNPTGNPVTRLITDGKNWKHTTINFFMNHEDAKVLLDEQFLVKIIDMDFQEEILLVEPNPMLKENVEGKIGAPFYYDGNLVEINYNNNDPKRGKNFEVQVYYKSDDGEEYLLLDGVKQFIRDGNIVGL
ncbi:MAG: hypothetical protein ACJAT4_003343 [Granulosicoccus sp.]|jgi:hypothetical protein